MSSPTLETSGLTASLERELQNEPSTGVRPAGMLVSLKTAVRRFLVGVTEFADMVEEVQASVDKARAQHPTISAYRQH